MKKLFALFLLAITVSVSAQTDWATQPEVIQFQPPYSIVQTAENAINYTNGPVLVAGRKGIGLLSLMWANNGLTNGGTHAKSITVTVQESNDGATWTAVGNASLATVASVTNFYNDTYSSTNNYARFGVMTTPTAATAGIASDYLVPEPFTNSLAFAESTAETDKKYIALKMQGLKRYLQVKYAVAGSNNVYTVSGLLITTKQ